MEQTVSYGMAWPVPPVSIWVCPYNVDGLPVAYAGEYAIFPIKGSDITSTYRFYVEGPNGPTKVSCLWEAGWVVSKY